MSYFQFCILKNKFYVISKFIDFKGKTEIYAMFFNKGINLLLASCFVGYVISRKLTTLQSIISNYFLFGCNSPLHLLIL